MFDERFLSSVGAVVLAAGKGTRLNCIDIPKVMLKLDDRPIVDYTAQTLKNVGLNKEQICLVVGFCKEKVMDHFGDQVIFSVQEEQKGTAHAAYIGMKALPKNIKHVLVMGGDDSAFYRADTLTRFVAEHMQQGNVLTLLSAHIDNPGQLGRVVRLSNGDIEVVEKENMTEEHKNLREISTGTFVFDREWFENIYPIMPPIPKLNEFGLPMAFRMAKQAGVKHGVIVLPDSKEWFGINTPEELEEARRRKNMNKD